MNKNYLAFFGLVSLLPLLGSGCIPPGVSSSILSASTNIINTLTATTTPTTNTSTTSVSTTSTTIRKPAGIYVVFSLPPQPGTNFAAVLNNPAVSGITVKAQWDTLNPREPSSANAYDWSSLDGAFNAVNDWNTAHPNKPPKTIQILPFAGFYTPAWALAQIPGSCNSLFQNPPVTPSATCGQATFLNSEGQATPKLEPLPLPWDPTYQSLYKTFLEALNARYGDNPAFVSISVAGPTASSDEMILPHENLPSPLPAPYAGPALPANLAGQPQTPMWQTLIDSQASDPLHYQDPAYINSDQLIIDSWDNAIDTFASVFNDVTLVVTTGDQLPNFPEPHPSFAPPNNFFAQDCSNDSMDCAAETAIEYHFTQSTVGENNAKATQTSGLSANTAHFDMGNNGVKLLSADTYYSPRILGGEQFGTSFSRSPVSVGCPTSNVSACAGLTPEKALHNTLTNFFNGTPAGSLFGGTNGPAPLDYLQIYARDIMYVNNKTAAQPDLDLASKELLLMAANQLNDSNYPVQMAPPTRSPSGRKDGKKKT